uniref:EIF-4F 25 kDa subunit n=1 Tax=Arcella intermedia TaxID=1963864 RepID=A0A6B2LI50_9EUKA
MIKHPLQSRWCWWYDNYNGKTDIKNFGDSMIKIFTFDTVEDFWCLWNNIKGANELVPGSNYHVFKEGIQPKWEDDANRVGGRWIIQLKTSQRNTDLNDIWMHGLLACIGNCFEDEEEVLGLVVNVRKNNDKICLWTRNARDKERTTRIGQQLKDSIGYRTRIQYLSHSDSMSANASYRPIYEI